MRTEVRFSGFGGQGIGIAGFILGKAACIYASLQSVMTQNYGPESRGGASNADVVIEKGSIAYPKVLKPTILILMSQEAYVKNKTEFREAQVVLVDEDLVHPDVPHPNMIKVPFTRIAEEQLGRKLFANIVMLGALAAASDIVPKDAMLESIKTTVPAKTIDKNVEAFNRGYNHVKEQGVKG